MLRDKFFEPTLEYLRKPLHTILATGPGSQEYEGSMSMDKMRQREIVLNFIDPISYYMMFFQGEIRLNNSTSTPGSESITEIFSIYNAIGKFFYTRNRTYIDFRNGNGYSLNYYKDNQRIDGVGNAFHVLVEINNSGAQEISSYPNYWPVLSLDITFASFSPNQISLGFRNEFNPKPLLYLDYCFVDSSMKLATNDTKFLTPNSTGSSSDYSEEIILFLPNIPSVGKPPALNVKLVIGRREDPPNLPLTVVSRDFYLDNAFGPVISLPTNSNTTSWTIRQGRILMDASKELGIQMYLEQAVISSATEVIFTLNILNYRNTTLGGILGLNVNSLVGSDSEVSGTNAIRQALSDALEVRKSSITLSNQNQIVCPVLVNTNSSPELQYLFALFMTRIEYDDQVLTAASALEANYHDVYIKLTDRVLETSASGTNKFYKMEVSVAGISAAGNYEIVSSQQGLVVAYTVDGYYLGTESYGTSLDLQVRAATNSNAFIPVAQFIEDIQYVEHQYMDVAVPPLDISPAHTCTRIRVHSYGLQYRKEGGLTEHLVNLGFRNALPDVDYGNLLNNPVDPQDSRFLFRLVDPTYTDARNRLTARADENGYNNNRSPYLRVPNPQISNVEDQVDMGQVLYGFESIISPFIATGYEEYPINDPLDLTAIIANIATPAAEVAYHLEFNKTAQPRAFAPPQSPDLLRYYEISAPDADLHGNADAIGVYRAYRALVHNQGIRYSHALNLYYFNSVTLGFTIAQPNDFNYEPYYNVSRRWLILARHFRLVLESGNQYKWLPELSLNDPDYSEWISTKNIFLNKMYHFAEFWFNHFSEVNETATGLRITFNGTGEIRRFADPSLLNVTTEAAIQADLETSLVNIFLPFVKGKIDAEDPNILIP
jgi:hypothetical protein